MSWTRRILLLAGVFLLYLAFAQSRSKVEFDNLKDAQTSLERAGYHCVGDCADGRAVSGFVVSRTPMKWVEANNLRKAGPMGTEWEGKAWIAGNSSVVILASGPGDKPRKWGEVLAFGDREFLDELERGLSM